MAGHHPSRGEKAGGGKPQGYGNGFAGIPDFRHSYSLEDGGHGPAGEGWSRETGEIPRSSVKVIDMQLSEIKILKTYLGKINSIAVFFPLLAEHNAWSKTGAVVAAM